MWRRRTRARRRPRRTRSEEQHYQAHKEAARQLIHTRLAHHNAHYQLHWRRVAVKAQRGRWGSCSSLGNLNFNYRLLFLPEHLREYIIVHELCHLRELNHGPRFWALVAERCPDYRAARQELATLDRSGLSLRLGEERWLTDNWSAVFPARSM
ncbi:MAG: M48 family metallopeptidase [Patescibacteria group bacterium]